VGSTLWSSDAQSDSIKAAKASRYWHPATTAFLSVGPTKRIATQYGVWERKPKSQHVFDTPKRTNLMPCPCTTPSKAPTCVPFPLKQPTQVLADRELLAKHHDQFRHLYWLWLKPLPTLSPHVSARRTKRTTRSGIRYSPPSSSASLPSRFALTSRPWTPSSR
jgi:hypothetical protein